MINPFKAEPHGAERAERVFNQFDSLVVELEQALLEMSDIKHSNQEQIDALVADQAELATQSTRTTKVRDRIRDLVA